MRKAYDITEYGVVSSRDILQTEKIQAVIDRCYLDGGGEVHFPAGEFLTGGLILRSHVCLYFESGAKLYGIRDCEQYDSFRDDTITPLPHDQIRDIPTFVHPYLPGGLECEHAKYAGTRWHHALIRADYAEDIAIIGEEGSYIDGCDCYDELGEENYRGPHAIGLWKCRNIRLLGYTVRNSANWAHAIFMSENIVAQGITVLAGHDGIHLRNCTNAVIRDCVFHTGDDCIAGNGNTNLLVDSCLLNSSCSAFRLGCTNALITRTKAYGPGEYYFRGGLTKEAKINGDQPKEEIGGRNNMLSFFTYYSDRILPAPYLSGQIHIVDCEVRNADRFIHYNFSGKEPWQEVTPMESISFSNVTAEGIRLPLTVYGDKEIPVLFLMENCKLSFREDIGPTPSFHICNVKEFALENVEIHNCSDAPLIKSWQKDPEIRLRDVSCDQIKDAVFTEEAYICEAI
ncbi:MAG: right-handed parallel beta-helix repeat-containing protein [Lachnospiraceae bacterium]|nr:right-handed parallel beta-helix repeat-containing protein [Lachnospiraceae bacterium]